MVKKRNWASKIRIHNSAEINKICYSVSNRLLKKGVPGPKKAQCRQGAYCLEDDVLPCHESRLTADR